MLVLNVNNIEEINLPSLKFSFGKNSTKLEGLESDGWLRDSDGNLIFWVPGDMRHGVQDMSLMTLPLSAPGHSVVLDCTKMCLGEKWVQVEVL